MASCQWSRDGDKVTPTNMRAERDRLHLTYRVRIGGGEWEDVNETVRIVRTPCRFGGARPYFVCPGVVKTPLWAEMAEADRDALYRQTAEKLLVGYVGEAEEIAEAYLYLMRQTYGTGQVLVVDGGAALV